MEVLGKLQNSDDATKTNLFLIERIYQKLISFQSRIKKNKFKSFRHAVERMEVSSCGKQNPPKLTSTFLEP